MRRRSRQALSYAVVMMLTFGTSVAAQGAGTLTGVVREDSTTRPVGGAVVAVEALKRQTLTDAEGRFRLVDVTAGVRMVTVWRLGYTASGTMVQFLPNETVEKVLTLSPTPAELDTMKVADKAPRSGVLRDGFAERQKFGFGHFYDSTALGKRGAAKVSDLLSSEIGVNVVKPPMCTPLSRNAELRGNIHHFNCSNSAAGTVRVAVSGNLCALKILLNGTTMNVGGEIDVRDEMFDRRLNWNTVFDISSIEVGSLEKVEIYRRENEVPMDLRGTDTQCGLLVLWSRQ